MANLTKLTPSTRERFLRRLAAGHTVTAAARAIKVSRGYLYQVRAEEPDFAAEWDAAYAEGTETLEEEALRRATRGVRREDPVFFMGVQVGKKIVTTYSDTLLLALLKKRDPEKWRERFEHTGKDGGAIEVTDPNAPTDAQRADRILALLELVRQRQAEQPAP